MHELNRKTLATAFALMGEYLRDRKVLGEIAVYGGSAIMLQFEWRASTIDVDARITDASTHGKVQSAVWYAADRLGLGRSWLNEAVTQYLSREETPRDLIPMGYYPDYGNPGLRVVVATPRYLLAMKLMAVDRREQDLEDAANLAMEIGLETYDEMLALIGAFYPNTAIPTEQGMGLRDLERIIELRRAMKP